MVPSEKYIITREFLVKHEACEEQLELFDHYFPEGKVLVTEELAIRFAHHFCWDWIAEQTLRDEAWYEYDGLVSCYYDQYMNDGRGFTDYKKYVKKTAATWAKLFLSQSESEPSPL